MSTITDIDAEIDKAIKRVPDNRNKPEAKIILDSISVFGIRLTTFEVTLWRAMLAEFNTHRVFSRNSESSRAVPFFRKLAKVLLYPAGPVRWPAEQKGMQGGEELSEEDIALAMQIWLDARDAAIEQAKRLAAIGVHKSICNRLLEPFMWHTILVTATSYQNYVRQRVSPLAQPEIEVPSSMLWDLLRESEPTQELKPGDWHTPLIRVEDVEEAWECFGDYGFTGSPEEATTEMLKRISVGRCCRVSFLTHDGVRDLSEDLRLYNDLVSASPMHASPLEHVATPDPYNVQELVVGTSADIADGKPQRIIEVPKYGNFVGYKQHRHEVEWAAGIASFT